MNLTFEQIQAAVSGSVRTEYTDDALALHRFTEAQEQIYRGNQFIKAFATAGVFLEFDTDSTTFSLSVTAHQGSSRRFFTHSVFVDGQRIGGFGGEFDENWTPVTVNATFSLPTGQKRIKVVFPWSAASRIRSLSLDDGASFVPVKKEKKVLIFGDSITQGYDALLPENTYTAQLLNYLDAEGFNKAIGGETFVPRLAQLPDSISPDLIVVTYGTNDWKHKTKEELERDSLAFCQNLRKNYPHTRILLLAPIWRADLKSGRPDASGPFESIADHYHFIATQVDNLTVIDCIDFLPRSTAMFSDEYLHPNDEGFRHYGAGLLKQLAALGL